MQNGTVHIWRVPVDPDEAHAYRHLLSDDEAHRVAAFRFEHDSIAFTHAHAVLRLLLGRYLQSTPADIQFAYESLGKPYVLLNGDPHPWLRFSLSHTKGLAVIAVAEKADVGVDVEVVRDISERATIAASHFSDQERQRFGPEQDDIAFFGCWTRKEAVLKASGTGLGRPLHTFGVVPQEQGANGFRVVGQFPRADRWRVQDFAAGPGFAGAVSVAADRLDPLLFDWGQQLSVSDDA